MVYKNFDHPIKLLGLGMNRIMYSNTKVAVGAFPHAKAQQFDLSFKFRTFEGGKPTSSKCKYKLSLLFLTPLGEQASIVYQMGRHGV